jgi:hypothetical protein
MEKFQKIFVWVITAIPSLPGSHAEGPQPTGTVLTHCTILVLVKPGELCTALVQLPPATN